MRRVLAALAAAAMAASCAPPPAPPAPAPAPPPPAPPLAPPAPVPFPPPPVDWRDAPLSPGDWTYVGDPSAPLAEFRSERASFSLRCERSREIRIAFGGVQSPALIVRTSFGERRLSATAVRVNEMVAAVPVADPWLDEIAFSRGRFLVQPEGAEGLVLPAWPEPARVIEECRGQ